MALDDRGAPPFKPVTTKNTVKINYSSSSASANVALPASTPQGAAIRIYNNATDTVFITFGTDNTVTATTSNGIPILNGTVEIIRLPDDVLYTYIAGIPNSSVSGNIYFTVGLGV